MSALTDAFRLFFADDNSTVLLLDRKKRIIDAVDNQGLLAQVKGPLKTLDQIKDIIGGAQNLKILNGILEQKEYPDDMHGILELKHRSMPGYMKVEYREVNGSGEELLILKLREKQILELLSEASVSAEGLFPALIHESVTGLIVLASDARLVYANRSALEFLEIKEEDLSSKSLWDFTRATDVSREKELLERLLSEDQRFMLEKEFKIGKGQTKWGKVHCTKVQLPGVDEFIHYSVTDISELRKAMSMLEEKSSLYTDLVEHAPVGIVVHQEGKVKFANREVIRSMGFDSVEDLLEKNIDDFIYKEDKPYVKGRIGEMLVNDRLIRQTEERLIRKDGSIMYAIGSANRVIYNGKPAVQAIFSDITERKKVENDRLRLMKQQEKHNKDLQEFAYVVSHNLRSPVSSILGLVDLAYTKPDDAGLIQEVLRRLRTTSKELNTVIEDLSEILVARKSGSNPKSPLDLEELLYPVLTVLSREIEVSKAEITHDFSGAPEVTAVKSYMNNIFFNLIQNAIKYSKPGRNPKIEIRSKRKENTVVLTIKDHGMGIDMKASDRVFGLYQRFHTHKDGRGMGLYLVKSQIESMGAEIDIKSAVGRGTTFTITFYE